MGEKTPGQTLTDLLTFEGDPEDLRALCEEAGRIRDRLNKLHEITSGNVDEWLRLRLPGDGAEIVVYLDSAVAEQRQLATVFRQLLAEIHRRRDRQGDTGRADDILDDL